MIRDSPAFTAQPVGFEPVRIPQSAIRNGAVNGLALWRPVPPRGFVALGLVATVINITPKRRLTPKRRRHTRRQTPTAFGAFDRNSCAPRRVFEDARALVSAMRRRG